MDLIVTLNSGAIVRLNNARRLGNYLEGALSGSNDSHMIHEDDYASVTRV